MFGLPATLPSPEYPYSPGGMGVGADVDYGGYDILLGGYGFRYMTDTNNPYRRSLDQLRPQRADQSNEPGEQVSTDLPWVKSQSSFHGGAGQRNLEPTADSAQLAHIRFDTSLGVDVWTPGQVKRLPATIATPVPFTIKSAVTGTTGTADFAVVGGGGALYMLTWGLTADTQPVITQMLSPSLIGPMANILDIPSMTTDGVNWYALVQLVAANGDGNKTLILTGQFGNPGAVNELVGDPALLNGVVGWSKARLMAGLGPKFYEIDVTTPTALSTLTPLYTHPVGSAYFRAISESPTAILGAVEAGLQSTILKFTLDTSGAAPVVTGGAAIGKLPVGERLTAMQDYLGSFLVVGSTAGVRVATFDTYTGAMKLGPLSVLTSKPVLCLGGRDRFAYLGYTAQQADGSSGLARVDLGLQIDQAGHQAWAPDLRPPSTTPTANLTGPVRAMGCLPFFNRIVYFTNNCIFSESGSTNNDPAWLRTSRIRFGTSENKLFKLGRVTGTLDSSQISISGITPFGDPVPLGLFGFITDANPPEFRLPSGLNEWVQLQFGLEGQSCVFNTFQAKAIPAPIRQDLITFTVQCYTREKDRTGLDAVEQMSPRQRYDTLRTFARNGQEVRFVEFTNTGPVAQLVTVSNLEFDSQFPPTANDDFGGALTLQLRTTE